jgi:predicted acylesterase/phospholipase RssA
MTETGPDPETTKIKHLVLSGGNIWGLYAFGAIKACFDRGFLQCDHIQSIHGTSVGSLIAVMLATGVSPAELRNYLVNRPWDKLLDKKARNTMEVYESRGVFDRELFNGFYAPIFGSVDIPLDITLSDFYKRTGIDIHIYVTELNEFINVDLSHTTHPEWLVIEAVYASCCLPVAFSPLLKGGKCYVDGGVTLNYPLSAFHSAYPDASENEVLGISMECPIHNSSVSTVTEESTIIDYVTFLISQIVQNRVFSNGGVSTKYEITFYPMPITLDYFFEVLGNKDVREKLVSDGEFGGGGKLDEWGFSRLNC